MNLAKGINPASILKKTDSRMAQNPIKVTKIVTSKAKTKYARYSPLN